MPVSGPPTHVHRPRTGLADDRGGVAVIVALLLGSGVLLGMAALVVDVGNLYAERAQLQSGADAAALKVAQVCAARPAECTKSADNEAEPYARENMRDGTAAVTVCGSDNYFRSCPALPERLECVGSAPADTYVEVQTRTLDENGSTALPPVFAQAVLGEFKGPQVAACARAAWGPPARAKGLAMTISICDWQRGRKDGEFLSDELFIPEYDEKLPGACGRAGTSSGNAGGFRWLAGFDANCRATVEVKSGYRVAPGNSVTPKACDDALTAVLKSERPVLVPVFDAVSGTGANTEYRIQGFAAFVVTGWRLPSSGTGPPCADDSSSCIYGYFSQAVVPGGGRLGGPDLGAQIVALVG